MIVWNSELILFIEEPRVAFREKKMVRASKKDSISKQTQ